MTTTHEEQPPVRRARARVATTRAARYGKQLCGHFAKRIETRWDDPVGHADFGAMGACRMEAFDDHLLLEVQGVGEGLAQVTHVVATHLEGFGRRDGLTVEFEELLK